MRIVILDYAAGQCDVIVGVPAEKAETDGWVEEFLERVGYKVSDCYWMGIHDEEDYEGGGTIYEYGETENGEGNVNTFEPVNF